MTVDDSSVGRSTSSADIRVDVIRQRESSERLGSAVDLIGGSRNPSRSPSMSSLDVFVIRQFSEASYRIQELLEKQKMGVIEDPRKEKPTKTKKGKKAAANKPTTEDLTKDLVMDEHKVPLDELIKRLETDLKIGLSNEEAKERQHKYGRNELTPPKTVPKWLLFLKELTQVFSLLLFAGAALCFIAYGLDTSDPSNLYLGVAIAVVVILTACFSFYQNTKSEAIMAGFKNMLPPECNVLRGGVKSRIPASNLVPGDVVELVSGDKIPADIRVLEANSFKVDNSSLTGESEPQSRSPDCTHENPLETKNLAFYGTSAQDGSGMGLVISIGDSTVIGRIARLASSGGTVKTTLQIEMEHFVHIIACFAITLGIIFFLIGLGKYPILLNIIFAIGIIVANVPEGLLATVTVALSMTAKRLASKQVLVKNLQSVETLGSATCICSDKTGTLTQNRMTIAHIYIDGKVLDSLPQDYLNNPKFDLEAPTFKAISRCASVCNRAFFNPDESNMAKPILQRAVLGNASEAAMLKFCEPLKSVDTMRAEWPLAQGPNKVKPEIPFNSTNKFQLSIHAELDKPHADRVLLIKGAPERIMDRCTHIMRDGKYVALTEEHKQDYERANYELASRGERVLGFAELVLPANKYGAEFSYDLDTPNYPTAGYCFLGLMSMVDPPRETVPASIAMCKSAGVKVVMVTGDQPHTAKAIAQSVGIIWGETRDEVAKRKGIDEKDVAFEEYDAIVVHGSELSKMNDEELERVLVKQQIVFARTSPQQKLQIVSGFQRLKHIVAVTGDGVNDSPALKQADIGVAMGIAGSDVAKETADMILLNDDFSAIIQGVQEGRLIFDNLKKSIAYTLTSNTPEIFPFILFIAAQIPLPLTTVLILAIDLGTDMLPAISLAYERAESDIMLRPPRNAQTDRLVPWRLMTFAYYQIGMWQVLAGFFAYFVVMRDYGFYAGDLVGLAFVDITVDGNKEALDWITTKHAKVDLRTQFSHFSWQHCNMYTKSPDTGLSVCYTTEALKYAQTAFFCAVVVMQWYNAFTCKTRTLSVFTQGVRNYVLIGGIIVETGLALLLAYAPFMNTVFGSRPVEFVHLLAAFPFAIAQLLYDEIRKLIMRTLPKKNWLERYTLY